MDSPSTLRRAAWWGSLLILILCFAETWLLARDLPVVTLFLIAALPAAAFALWGGYLSRESARLAERHRSAERELHSRLSRTENTLTPILDQTEEAILILDLNEVIRSCNPAARDIFGYPADQMIGQPYSRLLPNGDPKHEGFLKRLNQKGKVQDFQTTRCLADGSEIAVSISRYLVKGDEGLALGTVEILRDLSEYRRIEQELLTTEKMAAVGKMSSKVVHEIRNPLASISLNVDLLGDSLHLLPPHEESEATEILQNLKRETRRLRQITEEYLQFSRLLRKEFRLEDVNQVLLELADFARPEFRRKGIQILLRLDEKQPKAMIDAGSIRQAGLNLVRNAMEAADPQGHIRLSTLDLGDRVEIRVADDGCGIAEEDLPHIYDPFFTTKRDGTGLGLAVVRQIVEEHGGRIQVRSLVGRGTTFVIFLPKKKAGGKGKDPQKPQAADAEI
ncbi:MAG: PAS domain S-box protein [Candidatus Eisenbacteria bacterium]|uniref:histidine kinase n=1 Tax=Eiseniibacteriota bacterium TaxID=2212470 RepID=A0A948W360_UNCEI|nr:PAS domain S-box protein [Candidatus Eisenbacteria bacterium]MBU1947240.1 PAS domain S-box protein [Candidatus Eisenbacteria bacterium]MBU2690727.1 PAS domain S-box protein [Candidatus Eisenbacteria bacterium]